MGWGGGIENPGKDEEAAYCLNNLQTTEDDDPLQVYTKNKAEKLPSGKIQSRCSNSQLFASVLSSSLEDHKNAGNGVVSMNGCIHLSLELTSSTEVESKDPGVGRGRAPMDAM